MGEGPTRYLGVECCCTLKLSFCELWSPTEALLGAFAGSWSILFNHELYLLVWRARVMVIPVPVKAFVCRTTNLGPRSSHSVPQGSARELAQRSQTHQKSLVSGLLQRRRFGPPPRVLDSPNLELITRSSYSFVRDDVALIRHADSIDTSNTLASNRLCGALNRGGRVSCMTYMFVLVLDVPAGTKQGRAFVRQALLGVGCHPEQGST